MRFALPYILFVLSFFFFQYLPKSIGKSEKYYIPRIYVIVSLLFFLGFRGFIITDWYNYYPFFEKAPSFFDDNVFNFISEWPWEKGFIILTCLIKTFSHNYFIYQFILFAIDLFIINKIIREYVNPNYYALAYISFFVFQGFIIEVNLLRNAQSILIFLLSLKYARKQCFIKYLILNSFGILFHVSAVFYIPLYFILNREFPVKPLLIAFIIGHFFFFFHISWITGILEKILPLLGQSRFASMIKAYGILNGNTASYSIGVGFIERTGIFLLVLFYQKRMIQTSIKIIPFINLFYLFYFSYLFLAEFSILVERISMLFVPGYWIIIPALYGCMKKDWKKCFLVFLILYCILKMIVQCDEPFYNYSNALIHLQDYNYSSEVLIRSMNK